MALDIEKEIKIMFLAAFIVSIIYGLWYLISVESWVALVDWPYLDPVAGRTIGSFLTAMAIVDLKAFKEANEWEKIENVVILGAIWCTLGAISAIIGFIAFNLPPSAWLTTIILIVFAILNIHIYIQKRK